MNRVLIGMERTFGLRIGPVHVLSVPGRKSGAMRATPISLLTVGGQRYIVGGTARADWVRNARAAGWGILRYGRTAERVALVDLPEAERAPILREFPRQLPRGVSFFRRLYDLPEDPAALPDAFAALAPQCAVFRIAAAN
jgi:deazaflavin-dependent oxidoreductase (nitroreductase family)